MGVDIVRCTKQASGTKIHRYHNLHFPPDSSSSMAHATSAFKVVKKPLKDQDGIRYIIFHPAKFRITHNGTKKDFWDLEKVMAYVKVIIRNEETVTIPNVDWGSVSGQTLNWMCYCFLGLSFLSQWVDNEFIKLTVKGFIWTGNPPH